jgi:hypothetical protein
VFPCNRKVVQLFSRLSTQWRTGMGGPTGMDYTLPLKLMDRMNLSQKDYDQMLDDLYVMEVAALNEMSKEDK